MSSSNNTDTEVTETVNAPGDTPDTFLLENGNREPQSKGNSIPDDLYRQQGFQIALQSRTCPEKAFNEMLETHTKWYEERKERLIAISKLNTERYLQKIKEACVWTETELANLRMEDSETEKLLLEKTSAQNELDLNIEKLVNTLEMFYKARPGLIKEKIQTIQAAFNETAQFIHQSFDRRKELYHQFKEEYGSLFDEKIKWLQELKNRLVQRYEDLQEDLKQNDRRGIGPALYFFLIAIGSTGAVVGGWFFAAFINAQHSESFEHLAITQVLSNLMDFSRDKDWYYLVSILAGFLSVTFLLSYYMHQVARKLEVAAKDDNTEDDREEDSWEMKRVGIDPVSGSIRARNWLSFVVKTLPWMFIVGIMLILMAYTKHWETLAGSLTGETIGFLTCIAFSGAAYIYISNKRSQSTGKSTRQEIFILLLLFCVFNVTIALVLIFFPSFIVATGPIVFKQFFTLINFVLVMSMTAMILGYGHYFKGVVAASTYLNWKINRVDEQIRRKSGIQEIFTNFRNTSKKLNELGDVITEMTLSGADQFKQYQTRDHQPILDTRISEGQLLIPGLPEAEAHFFPEYDLLVKAITANCISSFNRLREMESRIQQARNRKADDRKAIQQLTESLNNRVHQWNNEIIEEEYELLARVRLESEKMTWEQVQLKDGFQLGMIYRLYESNVLPGYYHPCSVLEIQKD